MFSQLKKKKHNHAQTFIEYTLLIGVIVAVLAVMTPWIRRGIQGMVRMVSDQIGVQQNADQLGGDFGHLVRSDSEARVVRDKVLRERIGVVNYEWRREDIAVDSITIANQGFTERFE